MRTCLENAVFIARRSHIISLAFERITRVAHGDGKPFGQKHANIVAAVAKNNDIMNIGLQEPHQFFDAVALVHGFDEDAFLTVTDDRQAVEVNLPFPARRAGNIDFVKSPLTSIRESSEIGRASCRERVLRLV